ncbi:hypothetical protein ACFDR9_001235 [Janthinobacterium sp. CG_23.3]|uniref:hypothetical protein n=1 Tax=Janthinobacterium sp. CG_23.3 TaxID=3349634 RepID=UPI0038D50697
MSSHLAWPHFAALMARFKWIETELAQGNALASLYLDPTARAILKGVERSIDASTVASCVGVPALDEFLAKIHTVFSANHAIAGLSATNQGLVQSVGKNFLSQPCAHCHASIKCSAADAARMANSRNIEHAGTCFVLLRELFDFVVGFCRQLCARYASNNCTWLLELNTAHLNVRNSALDLAVTGRTRETPGRTVRAIELHFYVPDVVLADYYACLYILFHECFVHGCCGLSLDSSEAGYSDMFHEGWMDWVGLQLLEQQLGEALQRHGGRLRGLAKEFVNAGRRAQWRRNDFARPSHNAAAEYASGAAAALDFWHFCGVTLEDAASAWDVLFRFSVGLNLSQRSDEDRALMVDKVREHLSGSAAASTFIEGKLSQGIQQFALDGQVGTLLSVIHSL